jgi:arabinan endo-1,5-alpha-L-arabinosidase
MSNRSPFVEHGLSTGRRRALQSLGLVGGAVMTAFATPWNFIGNPGHEERRSPDVVFRVGEFNRIYDPSIGEKGKWYINDHTLIRADNGQWHLFGITHQEPANAQQEKFFAHAIAPELAGPWTKLAPVMHFDEAHGETVVWAPYVLKSDDRYWMFYCAGGKEHTKFHIHLATSTDLSNWSRHTANPMVVDGYDARDPMVGRFNDKWVMYYAATSRPEGGNHTVKLVTSPDLSHWSNKQEAFRDSEIGTYGGPTESPFVVERHGKYYLFVCTNHGYNETAVYVSDTPLHWEPANLVGKFPAHAAEVVQTPEGKWFVSRAGWGQGGVYLAELTWQS